MWHDHNIDFVRWLNPAMWHVALESWQWIHQVTAPCNVTRGSGMTCHWIRPNVRHIGILQLVSISTHHRSRHVILYQSAKFYPNRTTLGNNNNNNRHINCLVFEKIAFFCILASDPRWQISAIVDFRGPIIGSLKSLCNLKKQFIKRQYREPNQRRWVTDTLGGIGFCE